MTEPSFLVSSAGRRGELVGILREVLRLEGSTGGVYATDMSEYSAAAWLADDRDLVPPVSDPTFTSALLDICRRRAVTVVVPTIDPELAPLAAVRDAFAQEGIQVWVPSVETVTVAQDKRRTHHWLRQHGFPCVEQVDLEVALADPGERPRVAKPARGSSSTGLARVHARADLERLDPALDYVVEELAAGQEYTVDVLVDGDGRCRVAVPRQRIEVRAGEVSKARTVRVPAVEELARRVAETLPGAYGVMNVQIFHDEATQTSNVIEINARFGGGFPLSWAAGSQMPRWLLQASRGEKPTAPLEWLEDQVMLRYDAAVHLDWRR